MFERLEKIREIANLGIKIQNIEDLSPAKAIVAIENFAQACDQVKKWEIDSLKLLNRLGFIDLSNMFNSISSSDEGIGLIKTQEGVKMAIKNRGRIQFDMSRLLSILLLAETRALVPALTLDTNIIIHYSEKKNKELHEDIETFVVAASMGKISLVVTTRVKDDVLRDVNDTRRRRTLKYLARIPEIGVGFRIGISRIGQKDYIASDEYKNLADQLQEILFPQLDKNDKHYKNKLADIDHLAGHKYSMRDYFVTLDMDFLKKRDILAEKFSIEVLKPEECIYKII